MAVLGRIFGAVGNLFGKQGASARKALERAAQGAKRVVGRRLPKLSSPIQPLKPVGTNVYGTSVPTSKVPEITRKTVPELFEVPAPEPTGQPAGEPLTDFYLGLTVFVESEHVRWIQYDSAGEKLYICFHSGTGNNAVYEYSEIDTEYADKVFNAGSHVGTMVWDYLRRRGTVFGWQKPYSIVAAGHGSFRVNFGGYHPKYLQRAEWEQEHANIPASGALPADWHGGLGPYGAQIAPVFSGKRQASRRGKGKNPPWYGQ